MSRNLRSRVERLESKQDSDNDTLPPQFWDALVGLYPIERLRLNARQLIVKMRTPKSNPDLECPVEQAIRLAGEPPIA